MVSDKETSIIDFDDGGFGWFMYDFATSLAIHQAESFFEDIYQSWIEGYKTVRVLTEEDLAMIPTFITCRFLVAFGWLHSRRHTAFVQKHQSDLTNLGMVIIRGYVQSDGKEITKFSKWKFIKEMFLGRIQKLLIG